MASFLAQISIMVPSKTSIDTYFAQPIMQKVRYTNICDGVRAVFLEIVMVPISTLAYLYARYTTVKTGPKDKDALLLEAYKAQLF